MKVSHVCGSVYERNEGVPGTSRWAAAGGVRAALLWHWILCLARNLHREFYLPNLLLHHVVWAELSRRELYVSSFFVSSVTAITERSWIFSLCKSSTGVEFKNIKKFKICKALAKKLSEYVIFPLARNMTCLFLCDIDSKLQRWRSRWLGNLIQIRKK